jgi:predicted lipoprotein with Yx(FWY)xxD motif
MRRKKTFGKPVQLSIKSLEKHNMSKRLLSILFVVMAVLMTAAVINAQDSAPTLSIGGEAGGIGTYLVASNGMTVYAFKNDGLGISNCADQCAVAWPPYTVESADGLTVGDGIGGVVGTIARADGALQVTYNDMPLYFWANDSEIGDTTGNNFRTVWTIVAPATVYAQKSADHGIILVNANGMTLYTFTNDTPGVSNCTGGCLTNWPAVTVESASALVTAINLPGVFSTFDRGDGTLQVAYNGWPLYTFTPDTARGAVNGDGAGNVWFVAKP